MTKVAIITLNYNGKENPLELLGSLKSLKQDGLEVKIIIADNGSNDGSVSAIRKKFKDVDILQTGQNLGYAGGFNRGIEYAAIWEADYCLIINNDCLVKDTSLLGELIKTLKTEERAGMVSPKIYFAAGFEFHKERYKQGDLGKVIWFAGGSFDWDNIGSVHRGLDGVDKGQYDAIEQSEIFSGACVLIKKEVFDKVGFFDEDYFLYFEDSDFAKRVREAGFKIYYNGRVAIYHKVSQSTGIGSKLTDYYHTRNRLIFGIRVGGVRTKFALLREAVRLLILGRTAQRRGVMDYFTGVKGGVKQFHPSDGSVEYPLKLSIGIVNYNTADLTKKLLESIFKKDSGFDTYNMEVIVLDNGAVDPCYEKIKEFLPNIKYLRNDQNEGFAKGYNKTIKYSLGEYYLMLNSDIEVLREGLRELVEVEDKFAGKAVLGCKLVFPDGTNQDSVFHLPTLWGAFKEYFLAQKGAYFMFEPKGENPVKVEGMVMACLMIPKKILNKIGLLDESTFIFFEDIEYAARCKRFGIPLYFVPSAKFIHHHGASTKGIGADKAYELLQRSGQQYHGKIYYFLLSLVLKVGQKLGRVKTPVSRWIQES